MWAFFFWAIEQEIALDYEPWEKGNFSQCPNLIGPSSLFLENFSTVHRELGKSRAHSTLLAQDHHLRLWKEWNLYGSTQDRGELWRGANSIGVPHESLMRARLGVTGSNKGGIWDGSYCRMQAREMLEASRWWIWNARVSLLAPQISCWNEESHAPEVWDNP
jgi:hypothetical protein